MSKLSDYLEKEKIDARRLLSASRSAECLRAEDRTILQARRRQKEGDESHKELADKRVRTGRPVSSPLLSRALRGDQLPRRARQRLLRAVNAVLQQKKKSEVTAADLF